ncbi:apoptosis-associated speck-like protein containing a CARD [Python bivittatus]|uniref:Apoptosis-associated speck-like protein containing a CARD n=1 Tax=Python bivittatus TaxID=176946 RepID=A0A9F2RB52_PYTBI|nr:apoptosis-associated speck-like protein containing a CARD [Python bivittatus]
MAKNVRCYLREALEDLTEDELRKFKANLNEFQVRPGYNNVPKGRLQKADALDLSDLLISYYGEDYALEVTAAVLSDSNCKPQARKLLKATEKGACSFVQSPMPHFSTHSRKAEVQPSEVHFIERHREALIQRTATVEGILDRLHGVVLNDEQYQKIITKRTNQDKMRELYKLLPSWNRYCKDLLYEVLKEKNKFLIDDLEGQ